MSEDVYSDLHKPAVIIAGCFVVVAVALSTLLILKHLKYYTNPAEQKWIVAVLFMVPVYAIESILSLWSSKLSLACDILRNCYEAFALYSFGRYLIACLGGEARVNELLEDEAKKLLCKPLLGKEHKGHRRSRSSLRNFCCQPCVIGKDLLTIEKFGLVQYMILKTVCAFLALILEICGVYGDGEFRWNNGQMWALYCLVQFYNVTHDRLKEIKPLAKFVSFKAIVFATWWQGVGIALLCFLSVLPKEGKLQTALQDFLICIEMAIAAVAHVIVFSVEPYRYVPVSDILNVTTEKKSSEVKLDEGGGKEKSAVVEETKTKVEAPGTSVTESVQDIIVEGGQRVVKDVVLTINQAMEPVEKGVTKIQEKIHHRFESGGRTEEFEVAAEEHVTTEDVQKDTFVCTEERVVK
ncbi:hypothetical protein MLD38_006957 [Melastoma candidum]|uniref:Uncharacterized protein n=1 Tax=Melastoma candidum TaxID=119954 RepID=A0ACB9RTB8_9MYRT|nr:hypothetical protein MLD38_006957 [Melastoma candidum]